MATIEEAKLRYPVGTIFSNINLGYTCENVKVTGVYYKKKDDNSISLEIGNADRAGSFTVYQDEKWAKITHYAIPEKWCVKITTENSKTLDAWRKKQSNFYPTVVGLMGWLISDKGDGTYTNWDSKVPPDYTEIRIEDFIKYIYKEEEKKEQSFPEYYECIKKLDSFTIGKIYKIKNKNALEAPWNFIDDKGKENGNSGRNHKYFIPSTYEEYYMQKKYLAQQTLVKQTVPEYWAVKYTESNFDTLERWRLSQIDVDKEYKAVVGYYLVSKHPDNSYLIFCHSLDFFNNKYKEITFKDFKKHFSIEEVKKEEIMEDLTGRWLKCIKKNSWSCDGKRPEIGEYVQVKRGTMNSTYLDVINKTGKEESFTLTRLTKLEEFTLMPIGFSPDVKKEECSKEHMPKYVEWIDDLGSNMSGKMCNSSNFKKGKIFNTKTDNIPESGVSGKDDWKTTWKWYYYNFKPSTREAYNSQNNIIEIIPGYKDVNLPYSAGFTYNTYPSKAVQNSDGNWYSQPVYSRELSYAIGHDPYKKEEKKNKIKEVKLPEVKKRLIF